MDEAATAPLWQKLHAMQGELKQKSLHVLFEEDKDRFAAFSLTDEDLLLDFSKTKTSRADLVAAARARRGGRGRSAPRCHVRGRAHQCDGETPRPACRAPQPLQPTDPCRRQGCDAGGERSARAHVALREALRSGAARPARGGRFTDVVNIGIGGSDLGPAMATLALAPYHDGPRAAFRLQCRRRRISPTR